MQVYSSGGYLSKFLVQFFPVLLALCFFACLTVLLLFVFQGFQPFLQQFSFLEVRLSCLLNIGQFILVGGFFGCLFLVLSIESEEEVVFLLGGRIDVTGTFFFGIRSKKGAATRARVPAVRLFSFRCGGGRWWRCLSFW